MQNDLGLSNTQLGIVAMAFTIAYGLFEIPTGRLGDRHGSRSVLARIVIWWSVFTALTGAAFIVAATASAAVLFPEPLHIVRESTDPISGMTSTVHEYCSGDRIATVNGSVTVIADYARGEITEIDRSRGTFSITSFADIVRASVSHGAQPVAKSMSVARALGLKQSADGRQLESYEFASTEGDQQTVVTVSVDRKTLISSAAAEALIGAAFPNRRSFVHDAIMKILSGQVQINIRINGELQLIGVRGSGSDSYLAIDNDGYALHDFPDLQSCGGENFQHKKN